MRPDDWNLPLFVHVLGAVALVGTLVVVLAVSAGAARGGDGAATLSRLSFRTLLIGVLPSFIVMRVGAEWIASEEGVEEQTWVGIGYITSDVGLLLTLIAIGLAWRASRRGTAGARGHGARGRAPARLRRRRVGDDDEARLAPRSYQPHAPVALPGVRPIRIAMGWTPKRPAATSRSHGARAARCSVAGARASARGSARCSRSASTAAGRSPRS